MRLIVLRSQLFCMNSDCFTVLMAEDATVLMPEVFTLLLTILIPIGTMSTGR